MGLMFAIRVLFSRENKRRDAEPVDDTYDNVFLTKIDQDGKRVEMKVSKVCGPFCLCHRMLIIQILEQEFLDLTDRQNRDFRYVL
jgi:ACS family allantoate permease-like MFS transporter